MKVVRVGIVGHGADKFTGQGEKIARKMIRHILTSTGATVMVSGHSPMGGVDIWAEEEAENLGVRLDLKIPKIMQWDPPNGGYGFKARNLDIARDSHEVHVIVVDKLPPGYTGRVFGGCYHCHTDEHVKSGACWTGHKAHVAVWHLVRNG